MIHDYFTYRNDLEFVGKFQRGIISVLDWFENKIDETGMLGNLPWWNFTDWAPEFSNGVPPGAEYGHSASVTLQYASALKNAADIFKGLGNEQLAGKYSDMVNELLQAVNLHCYDESRGLIAETPQKKVFSQHTNIFAILTGMVDEGDQKELMTKILHDDDLIQCTVYFKYYLFRALQMTGMGNEYLGQLQPWKTMLDLGLTTFAEREFDMRSDCHAWSASPCFDLLHTVAGIFPAEAGFKSVVIAPNPDYLKKIRAAVPHPLGMIRVDLKRRGKSGIEGTVELPGDLAGEFIWNEVSIELNGGKQDIKFNE